MASCSGVMPMTSSGSSLANCGSRPAWRGVIRPAVAIRSPKVNAMSLNARYCSSRANSRSRASMRARSSSSCGPVCGSSRADLMSSRVAAMSRNSEAWPRSHSVSDDWAALMWAMNSSVTLARAISVMSSLCLLIRPSSRSNGPEKLSRCTSNGVEPPRRVMTPPGVRSTGPLAAAGRRVGPVQGVVELHRASRRSGDDLLAHLVRPPHHGRSALGRVAGMPRRRRASTRRS